MAARPDQYYQTPHSFSQEDIPSSLQLAALNQARALAIPAERFAYPQVPGITIDPPGCKDRDDALFVSQQLDGMYQVLVTVPSVGEFIQEGSPLDEVARRKSRTRYQKGKAVDTMLPSEISQKKLSLLAGELRPTLTISITLDGEGEMHEIAIYRTCFRSPGEYSYEDALRMLQNPQNQHHDMLVVAAKLAAVLKERRTKRSEKKGRPIGIYTPHDIVGEFMVLANYAFSLYALMHNLPVMFRNYPDTREGCPMPEELRGGGAFYSAENYGHEGLLLDSYDPGTSSLRRWPDLHTQRVLVAHLDGIITAPTDELRRAALYVTLKERQIRQRRGKRTGQDPY